MFIETKQKELDDVKQRFQRSVKNHVVKQLHRDGDTVRLWRCGTDSSVYRFYICCPPGWMKVYGDMGEFQWSRTQDMVAFARSSVHSLDYFSEKIARNCQITEYKPNLVEDWLATVKDDWIENGSEWTDKQESDLNYLKDWWDSDTEPHVFLNEVYESSLCRDYEDIPTIKGYTYCYLWVIEGIKWFIEQLDADRVVKESAS